MDATLIVDGYNVLNAWPELIKLKDDNLSHARDKLVELVAGYSAFKGYDAIIVYDAHLAAANIVAEERSGLTVVYTGEGQTADSYIEKLAYGLVRQHKTVYVVTSDWAEQLTILGAGAYRISAREMYCDFQTTLKQQNQAYTETPLTYRRNEVSSRINTEVMRKLDEMRRRR